MVSVSAMEVTGLPETRAVRTARHAFEFASRGPAAAFATSLPLLAVTGVADAQLWLPLPLGAPLCVLSPGVVAALALVLPVGTWIGVMAAAWCAGALGTLTSSGPWATTQLLPVTVACLLGLGVGALVRFVYRRYRPQMVARLLTTLLPGAFLALLAAGVQLAIARDAGQPAGAEFLLATSAAYGIGLLLTTPAVFIWWLSSQGVILSTAGRRGELMLLVGALAALTLLGASSRHALEPPLCAAAILDVLVWISARYPMRTTAPVVAAEFTAAGFLWTRHLAHEDVLAATDALTVISAQVAAATLLVTILVLGAAQNERRLAEWRLRGYARRLALAEEEQRRASAAEMRESVAQTLTGVRFALDRLARTELPDDARTVIQDVASVLRLAQSDVDRSVREEAPQGIDDGQATAAIASFLLRLEGSCSARIDLAVSGTLDRLCSASRRLAFRVVAELARNAAAHSLAKNVSVWLDVAERSVSIIVSDDGEGFDPALMFRGQARESGLTRLRDRIASEGGSLWVRSSPGRGCLAEASFPAEPAGEQPC